MFRIFHLVEVGGEANEVEDGGGDKDVEEHTKQLPSQGHCHLLELISILQNQSGQVTVTASKSETRRHRVTIGCDGLGDQWENTPV